MSENDIVKIEETSLAIASMEAKELQEILRDNLGGEQINFSDLERLNIPAGGGTAWTIDGLDGEEVSKSVEGVIIHTQLTRSYWEGEFDGGSAPPDCFSDDAVTGIGSPGGDCASCPMAEFGSAQKGDGQACQQRRIIYFVREGELLPTILIAPPSSLKAIKKYTLRLTSKAKPFYAVVTRFELEKDKNAGGIEYSKLKLSSVRMLTDEERERVGAYVENIKPALTRIRTPITVTSDNVEEINDD